MLADLRQAFRLLARSRGFAVTTILILALGIGANTAVFSIVRAVLMRPLPYHEPDRLVYLWRGEHRASGESHGILTGQHVASCGSRNTTLESYAVVRSWNSSIQGVVDLLRDGSADRLRGTQATPNFFELLGVRAALGRTFVASDGDAEPVVVISDALWRRAFGADTSVLGRRITLRSGRDKRGWVSHQVIGILPPGFRFTYPEDTELFTPLPWPAIRPTASLEYEMIARLRPSATPARASAELTTVAKDAARARNYPIQYRQQIIDQTTIVAEPVAEHFRSHVRPGLLLLAGVAGLVLLIACVNLGLLVLARAVDRSREFAMRSALGAAPGRLLRQLMAEGVALAAIGGMIAFAATAVAMPFLRRLVPPVVPRADEIALDVQVLVFALAATAITAVVCGAAPAWLALGRHMQAALRQSGGGATASRALSLTRRVVVGVQVAVVLVLLSGAALLIHSFWRMHRVDLGFDAEGVIAMEMRLFNPKYRQPGRIAAFERDVLDRARAVAGVERASLTTSVPMRGVDFMYVIGPKGRPARPGHMRSVDPDYFALMRIPVLAGRAFDRNDTASSPPVIVVSQSYGRLHFGTLNPVGRRLEIDDNVEAEIVGMVGDVRAADVAREPAPAFYRPRAQESVELICLVVRSATGARAAVIAGVRDAIHGLDPEQPVQNVSTIDAIVSRSTSEERFYALATGAFAAIAVLLAVTGLFGVVSRSVTERRREIAIRTALGADARSVFRLVFAYGLTPVVFGVLAGLWTAVSGAAVLQTFLFEVDAADPLTLGSVSAALVVVACAACYLPARKAISIEPMAALKSD